MRLLVGLFLVSSVFPQTFSSSAQIQDLIANAKKIQKPGQATVIQPILQLAPYVANLEYRTAVGPAAVHDKEDEMFYVIDGAGTLTTGGTLTADKKIDGGKTQAVAKGDMIMVPAGTPHWYNEIKGTLILMSIHLPK